MHVLQLAIANSNLLHIKKEYSFIVFFIHFGTKTHRILDDIWRNIVCVADEERKRNGSMLQSVVVVHVVSFAGLRLPKFRFYCCWHRTDSGPVLAHYCTFTGVVQHDGN